MPATPTPASPHPTTLNVQRADTTLLNVQRAAGNRAALELMRRTSARPRPLPLPCPGSPPRPAPVLRARLPEDSELASLLTPGPNESATTEGLRRLVGDALEELSAAQRTAVETQARGAQTAADFAALPDGERLQRLADAIRVLHPDRELGDPAQYKSQLRTGAQRANLTTLLDNTDQLFEDILAASDLNAWITEIFGAGQHSRVLRRLRRAKSGLQAAGRRRTISADMSGYSEEVGLGGFAVFQTHIALERSAIQNPNDDHSIQLTLHEAMHFGTGSVEDTIYLEDSSDFTTLATDDKVNNAAHYEVLALRVRDPSDALAFPPPNNVFTPGSSSGPSPSMTAEDEGRRLANRRYRDAWSSSIDLWEELRDVHLSPRRWGRARRYLPFWSAAEKLTIHDRTISVAGGPDAAPVTPLDLALAESFTKKLNDVWRTLRSQSASALESAEATAAEIASATTAEDHRDLLVKCALRASGIELTGAVDRDAEVLRLLHVDADRLFRPRDPATAPA